jgi:CRISPR-associated protein Csy1
MHDVSKAQVLAAINGFLSEQLEEKMKNALQELEKVSVDDESPKAQRARKKAAELPSKYELDNWMQEAATRMSRELSFGTHISKGVHPDSKGDNVNFHNAYPLPEGIIGSQTLRELPLDANGNAAALPLAAFFDVLVDPSTNTRIRDLIKVQHPALAGVFSTTSAMSDEYAQSFKIALDNHIINPKTDGTNKQILWPIDRAIEDNQYITLIPLQPSALTHVIYHRINDSRFGAENLLARDNRYKGLTEQHSYLSIRDIASLKLGGSNSQNVSRLTVRQRGQIYLLPSHPPKIERNRPYTITKDQETIFNTSLRWHCGFGLDMLFSAVREIKSTVDVRDQRKEAMEVILTQIIKLASRIRKEYTPGWSKEYNLNMAEKYWLDPKRSALEGEEEFSEARAKSDWIATVERRFSLWINSQLQKKFGDKEKDFADPEYREWLREIEQARKASERKNEGVFV